MSKSSEPGWWRGFGFFGAARAANGSSSGAIGGAASSLTKGEHPFEGYAELGYFPSTKNLAVLVSLRWLSRLPSNEHRGAGYFGLDLGEESEMGAGSSPVLFTWGSEGGLVVRIGRTAFLELGAGIQGYFRGGNPWFMMRSALQVYPKIR